MAKATAVRNIRDDHQKAFLKIFNSLCGRFNRWQVWQDFVMVTAIEISNATDKKNAPERTKTYQTIISKYSDAEQEKFAELLGEVIMGMEQNPDQDFLGELYMLCELGNDASGQFFTPYDVCRCMVEISGGSNPAAENAEFFSVSDPACGAGALLIAFANLCRRKNICYHDKVLFVAQDIDLIAGLMCYIQLSFLGCAGYVVIGNTITEPSTAYDRRGLLRRRAKIPLCFVEALRTSRGMCRQSGGGFFVFLELHLRSIFNAHVIDYLRRSPLYTRTSTQSDRGSMFPPQSRRASSVPQASQMYTPLAWRLNAP